MAEKKSIWSKDFVILFIVSLAVSLGFQMLNPNMAGYADSLGIGVGFLGFVVAAFGFAALVARPFSGRAADKLNNKKLILISVFGLVLSVFAYTFVNGFAFLLVVRFAHGLCFGLNSTLTMTMASRTLPEERMGSGMAIFSLGMTLSLVVAPSMGITISNQYGFQPLFYISSVLMIVALLLLFLVKDQPLASKDPNAPKEPVWRTFFAAEALSPSTMSLLNACAFGTVNAFIVLYGKSMGFESMAIYFTVNAIALLITRPIFSKLMDKVPVKLILYPCYGFMIIAMIVLSQANSLPLFLISGVFYGIGNGGSMPALQTLSLKCVGPERRGAASGTYYMGLDIGNVIGPILAGALITGIGYSYTFLVMGFPIILSAAVLFISKKLPNKV